MSRACLHVRPATHADLPVLVEFAAELRELLTPEAARARPLGPAGSGSEQRLRAVLDDPDKCLVLCVRAGDEPLAMGLLTIAPANPLLDLPAVHLSHAVVPGRHRRRGAGKALVAAAVEFAERRGIEQLVVAVDPGSREANRFFARLGFAPLAIRRTAPVAVVRRRLAEVKRPVGEQPRTLRSTGARPVRRTPVPASRALPLGRAAGEHPPAP